LSLTGPAEKAEAATLAFEMCPGAHEPALMVGQMRKLDLQRALAGAGAPTEDFQDQSGAIEHLGTPDLFEIALLNRRERAIHDHHPGFRGLDAPGNLSPLPLADEGRGENSAEGSDA